MYPMSSFCGESSTMWRRFVVFAVVTGSLLVEGFVSPSTLVPQSTTSSSGERDDETCWRSTIPLWAVATRTTSSASGYIVRGDRSDGGTSNDVGRNKVEFPPPLGPVDRLQRAATFWSTALPIVASYYGLINRIKLQELLSGEPLADHLVEELWSAQHADGAAKLAETITNLKGFYVKTAQIISSRQDLFPAQYTDALSGFTDNLDPMPAEMARAVVESELLNAGESFGDVFREFDDEPLGAASVAQVHRAVLTEKYGGREVAVKIQRPSIESKLLGDIANLKAIAKTFRDNPDLPLDYYTVFAELEKQLADEFDFVQESVSMERIHNSLIRAPDGAPRDLPLVMPRPVQGLVSRRVLVMDFLKGVPLSRAREEMLKRGVDPESPQAKLFARRLLTALTTVFGRNVLETGFFHADPHPGNIFVLEDGRIGLIDFGQVKQISGRDRETLAKVMRTLDQRRRRDPIAEADLLAKDNDRVGQLALELGVELKETSPAVAAAAVGVWLFDGSVDRLPGGYDMGEFSPNSPVKELKSFPQDLVLVGRSTILIKGLSNRLGIPWSLAAEWAPIARQVLDGGRAASAGGGTATGITIEPPPGRRVRFRQVLGTLRQWASGRVSGLVRKLPEPVRNRVAAVALKVQERKMRRNLTKKRRP